MEKKTRDSIFVFTIFSVVFIIAGITSSKEKKEVNKNGVYSIATIVNKKYGISRYYVYYEFKFIDSTRLSYERISDIEVDICEKYNRFLVKFSPNNLKYDEIYFNYPILEDSIIAPSEGWDYIPSFIEEIPYDPN